MIYNIERVFPSLFPIIVRYADIGATTALLTLGIDLLTLCIAGDIAINTKDVDVIFNNNPCTGMTIFRTAIKRSIIVGLKWPFMIMRNIGYIFFESNDTYMIMPYGKPVEYIGGI